MSQVLLYSGGMDSYALAVLCQPRTLLHVDMGVDYGKAESAALTVPSQCQSALATATLPLARWERPDAIIPGRNIHLIALAANYGDEVLIGATAGDRVRDKDTTFLAAMNVLLAHVYGKQWWLPEGRQVSVRAPAKGWSKRELVSRYLAAGGDGDALATESISCYNATPDTPQCGACKPCARKWVALTCNGVDPRFDARDYVANTAGTAISTGEWDRGRAEAKDILMALGSDDVHDK